MRNYLLQEFPKAMLHVMTVVFVFVFCSICFSSPVLAATNEKEMKEKAYQVMQEQLGLGKDDVDYYQGGKYKDYNDDTISIWSFTFLLKEHPIDDDGLIVISFSLDGALLSLQPPQKISLADQLTYSFSHSYPYTLNVLYELKQNWEPSLAEIDKLNIDPGYFIHKYIRVLRLSISLPAEDDYPLEDARKKAREVIVNLPGWTEEKLNMYTVSLEAFYASDEVGKSIYQFIYAREDCIHGKYANETLETYIEEYEKPLFALFGGTNGTTPMYISVRLDGKTGELIEEPVVAFPPIRMTEFDTLR